MPRNSIPADDGLVTDAFTAIGQQLATAGLSLTVVKKSTAQTVGSGVTAALTWDVELIDEHAAHSTTTNTDRITIPAGQGGLWLVLLMVNFGADSGTGRRDIFVKLNGSTDIARGLARGLGDASELYNAAPCWGVATLAAGDYVSASLWAEGSATTVQATSSLTAVRLA